MARQQDLSVMLYSGVTAPTIEVQHETGLSATSFYAGDLIAFTGGTGYVNIASAGLIAGIACDHSTATEYSSLDMELIMYNELYLITAGASTAVARANIGEGFELDFTPGEHYVTATTTTPEVHIYGIYGGNSVVTAGERYIVRFYQPNIESG